MTPERLAEILVDGSPTSKVLAAEVVRLRAQVADAWDEGWVAGNSDAQCNICGDPDEYRETDNPHRAALASGDEVQP